MISICIPVFNFDVRELVKSLHTQCIQLNSKSEIILIDDCSDISYRKINSEIQSISNYIQLENNIGRAKIRNAFIQYATYDYLLFLDCDSIIINPDFLKNYIDKLGKNYDVIVGGRIYSGQKPNREKILRWKYCLAREQKPADKNYRRMHFLSNNFLIKKSLLQKIRFDERLTEYGHEDTLFGYELKKAGIKIHYINNPVMNGELENNEEFLEKTEKSIENLILILKLLKGDQNFITEVTLLNNYSKLKTLKLEIIIYFIWKLIRGIIRFFLRKGHVSLLLFDFYKLGYLIFVMRNSYKTKSS
jgi:GT2 family glycosyltransferase